MRASLTRAKAPYSKNASTYTNKYCPQLREKVPGPRKEGGQASLRSPIKGDSPFYSFGSEVFGSSKVQRYGVNPEGPSGAIRT